MRASFDYMDRYPVSWQGLKLCSRQMVPCNMTLDRAWRWCVLATLRELRVMRGRGRDLAWNNLRRLFMRRWADTCSLYDLADDAAERGSLCEMGLVALGEAALQEHRARRAA